ncbi:MAG: arylsulfatase [Pirellulales bacterium]|nr:arylsulfatase [Pirellulales bacterium]
MKSFTFFLGCMFLWIGNDRALLAEAAKPNVLLVVADDLGWGDVGWHDGVCKTPTLDRLVREGIELDRHYVQPVCTPTRTALLTGRYPGRFGPHALAPSNRRALPIGTATLASALKSLGYETCQVGKWHLGSRPEWGPNHYGFDHSYGTLTGAADPWKHTYRKGPFLRTWHRDEQRLDEPGNATELVAAEAVGRIRQMRSPWFLYVAFHAVHSPIDAPEKYKKLYEGQRFDDDPIRHDSRLRLAAMAAQLDAKVGEFVSTLEEIGARKNTLIVFTSDNGGLESVRNVYVSEVADSPLNSENAPLRGQKNTLYEGGIRVCAFANWPGKLAPRKHAGVMHAVDWFPTLASLVGYKPDHDLNWDGIDQWSALTKGSHANDGRAIYIAFNNGEAILHDRWKLIAPHNRKPELYHLADDPYEKKNLAQREPDQVARLQKLLTEHKSKDVANLPKDLEGTPN